MNEELWLMLQHYIDARIRELIAERFDPDSSLACSVITTENEKKILQTIFGD